MKTKALRYFDTAIYPWKVWVYIGTDFEFLINEFYEGFDKKKFRPKFIEEHEAVTYIVQNKKTRQYGTLIATTSKNYLTTKLIAHEATHAARDLWEYVCEHKTGIEADAYLVGYIADCIYKAKSNK